MTGKQTHTDSPEDFLVRTGLIHAGETAVWTKLAGGVSSDVWRVELPGRTICVKRALAKLKVEADWRAPVERSVHEWEWFSFVDRNFPGLVPKPLAHDREMLMLAVEFLDESEYRLWKADLLKGSADEEFAAKVGENLGRIHAAAAHDAAVAEIFAEDRFFFALRIDAYLLATAERHPDLAPRIREIAAATFANHITLVHGDVSPKNILIGKNNEPVFLDAETAWFGDPAFDAAFCLNHLLLKARFRPSAKSAYGKCFKSLADAYLDAATWENRDALEARIARLLPVLFLARVDGKSPVEYITDAETKDEIRAAARRLLAARPWKLDEFGSLFE